jgi:hypothetical protein
VLALDTFILLGWEIILPGFVSKVFPLWQFYLGLLLAFGAYIFCKNSKKFGKSNPNRFVFIPLTVILGVLILIALYKLSVLMMAVYALLALFSLKLVYQLFYR